MKLHEKIVALRKAAGLTQSKLGEMLNVSAQAVSKWDNNECLPDLTLLPALCAALKIFRALSFTAISFEEEIAAHCGFAVEETRAAIFRLLKQEICQCAPEGYVLGANAYLVWAALAAAWLASPDGRDDVGEITVSYSSRT